MDNTDNGITKFAEEFIRPLRYVSFTQLFAFCQPRTPCGKAWLTVKDIFRKQDKRAASRRVFAAGFALGLEWYRLNSTDRTKELAERMTILAEKQAEDMFHKSKLDMLK